MGNALMESASESSIDTPICKSVHENAPVRYQCSALTLSALTRFRNGSSLIFLQRVPRICSPDLTVPVIRSVICFGVDQKQGRNSSGRGINRRSFSIASSLSRLVGFEPVFQSFISEFVLRTCFGGRTGKFQDFEQTVLAHPMLVD